ncbi:MAG: hypothetical protein ACRC2H_03685, partial [Silanimonas sp.]
ADAHLLSRPNPELEARVAHLVAYSLQHLGTEANLVNQKVRAVQSNQQFDEIVGKLYPIVQQYCGVKEAERFASIFGRG